MLDAAIHKKMRDFSLDFTISVTPGEIVVLMGENGAGKSSALNCISGIMQPDSGSIRLNGTLLFDKAGGVDVPVESRNIGYVFQRSAIFPHLSVRENIAFGLHARHLSSSAVREITSRWLHAMNIGDLAGVKAGKLSGGQKQRVAIARAMAPDPALLMLDEPFSGLDNETTALVKELIRAFARDRGIPCLVVTHRVTDSRDVGDRVCMIRRGSIKYEGAPGHLPGEFTARPRDPPGSQADRGRPHSA